MLSAKIAHRPQLSLYNFVICRMYYKIIVFKMAGKDCFWLLPYGIEKSFPHTCQSLYAPFQTTGQLQLQLKK